LQDNLVIDGIKYPVKVVRRGPIMFNVSLNNSNVDVLARKLGDGGFLLQVCWSVGGFSFSACSHLDGRSVSPLCVLVCRQLTRQSVLLKKPDPQCCFVVGDCCVQGVA
jgi:hypothetical protein